MTVEDVKTEVERIRQMADFDEDEDAHKAEDKLRQDVLQAIAESHPGAVLLAAEALKTDEIEFGRWYCR
jgi:hypothetical protein